LASDVYYSGKALAFIETLSDGDRTEWEDELWRFVDNPFPDDGSSVALPPPYAPGTYGHASLNFWFTFVMVNSEVIWIPAVQFRPGAPKDPNRGSGANP